MCAALPAARADGVVLKSTSARFSVGRTVRTGETLELRPAERLTVLDRTGRLVELSAAGAYRGPEDENGRSALDTARRLAAGSAATGVIGGVRSETLRDCLNAARREGRKDTRACYGAAPPWLDVKAASPARGGPVLNLSASFDGRAVCVLRRTGSPPAFLPGAEPAHPLRLHAGGKTRWPQQGRSPLADSGDDVRALVTCHAVASDVWDALPAEALALPAGQIGEVVAAFASARKAAHDREHVTLSGVRLQQP